MAGLLVSVRDGREAAAALEGGASLIDVKEPRNGALGRACNDAIWHVVQVVAGRVPVSVALGELIDEEMADLTGVSFAKYGLEGCLAPRSRTSTRRTDDWRAMLAEARQRVEAGPCRLVFVSYADWERSRCPRPEVVFRHAIHRQAAAVMIDTCHKRDGKTLLDSMPVSEAARLCESARSAGVRVALAGSLGVEQIQALRPAAPDWFAVRGAACSGGGRSASIDADRVRQLVEAAL
jgi:uncharacterized protein (UPF0264 family)